MTKNNIFYDKTKLLSHRMFFNIIVGNRGGGKTYGFKKWGIDDDIKNGRQFAWVRRYCTEIKKMRKEFFKDIAPLYPNAKFIIRGDDKIGEFLMDGKVIGYYFALSTSIIAKSMPFPLIDKIIFDEFLIMGRTYRYINDEVTLLLELIETIFRNREYEAKTDPTVIKPRGVFLIGNNVTIANPYYLYFDIRPTSKFFVDKVRGICVEQFSNEQFIEMKKQSSLGKLTKGTKYEEYAIENKAYLDNDRFIKPKPNTAKFNCAIVYHGKTYGFWLDYKNGNMYCNMQYDPNSYNIYSLTKDDHSINTYLVKNTNNTYIKNVLWLFSNGCMFFENTQIKGAVFEILAHFYK